MADTFPTLKPAFTMLVCSILQLENSSFQGHHLSAPSALHILIRNPKDNLKIDRKAQVEIAPPLAVGLLHLPTLICRSHVRHIVYCFYTVIS